MRKSVEILCNMTSAGVCIGLAAGVYTGCPDRVIGALLFSVGLLSVIAFKLPLFTGRVGLADADPETWAYLAAMLAMNFLGAALAGWVLHATGNRLSLLAQGIVAGKLARPWIDTLAGGVICCACMFLAVLPWLKRCKQMLSTAITIMSVATFIFCSGEHCVANFAFFCIAGDGFSGAHWWWLSLAVTGNTIGALGMRELTTR